MPKMVVKRLGVLSLGKMNGLICAALGLFIGLIYGLIFMLFGAAMMSTRDGAGSGAGMAGVGLAFIIGIPILYAIFGFVGGLIVGLVYNVAAGIIGGIELELENSTPDYYAPPPPQQQQWKPDGYEQPGY